MNEQLYNPSEYVFLLAEGINREVVIAAPHHAVGGVKELPCPTHKMSDENTGFIAVRIAELLKAHYAVVCNMRIDANKNTSSDYYQQLVEWNPKILVEIHGHGGIKVEDEIIEISSGKSRSFASTEFARLLQKALDTIPGLTGYKAHGDYKSIYFKAAGTLSVIDERWITFHIELPPSLRIDSNNSLPHKGELIANAISIVISQMSEVEPIEVQVESYKSVSCPNKVCARLGTCIGLAIYDSKLGICHFYHEQDPIGNADLAKSISQIVTNNGKENLQFTIVGGTGYESNIGIQQEEQDFLDMQKDYIKGILDDLQISDAMINWHWKPGYCIFTLDTMTGKYNIDLR